MDCYGERGAGAAVGVLGWIRQEVVVMAGVGVKLQLMCVSAFLKICMTWYQRVQKISDLCGLLEQRPGCRARLCVNVMGLGFI